MSPVMHTSRRAGSTWALRGDSLLSITRPKTVWSRSSVLQFQRWCRNWCWHYDPLFGALSDGLHQVRVELAQLPLLVDQPRNVVADHPGAQRSDVPARAQTKPTRLWYPECCVEPLSSTEPLSSRPVVNSRTLIVEIVRSQELKWDDLVNVPLGDIYEAAQVAVLSMRNVRL